MGSDEDQRPTEGAAAPRTWEDFAPLYDEHHERLFRVALLMCHGNRAAAEDAVAETFIKVFNTWSTGGVNNFFGYARQTLLNYVLGQYRHEQVVARHLNAQSGDLRGQRDAVDDVVDGSATFELLQELPPRQRAAIVLRFYEDLPYDQIAQTLGVTVGTVKAQVSVGLQKLRTIMETAQ